MKDPLLQTYTLEELLYEFHSVQQQKLARTEAAEEENDRIEEESEKEAQDWADRMEAEEEEAEAAALADPSKHPDNVKWMEEQLRVEKELYGEDFGEDISTDFNSPNLEGK